MKKISKIVYISLFVVSISPCYATQKSFKQNHFTVKDYPRLLRDVRQDLSQGYIKKALQNTSSISYSIQLQNLKELELGRLWQLNGNYKDSIIEYDKAIKSIPKTKKQYLEQVKQLLSNKDYYNYYDVTTSYDIPDYEITFLYVYQALNYLEDNNVKKALQSLNSIERAKLWYDKQNILAAGIKHIGHKVLDSKKISNNRLGLDSFKDLTQMLEFSKRIPDSYGNPMVYYIQALLDAVVSKNYQIALVDIRNAQKYTVGNKYIDQTADEFKKAINSQTSPFSMGMGRLVVLYEQGLVYPRKSSKLSINLGDIGLKNINLPVYSVDYDLFEPKSVVISANGKVIADTYTETLLDTTLFAMKSLVEEYSKIITQNVVIEAFNDAYKSKFSLGGLLGSTLKFDFSQQNSNRVDLRSWLLLPNSVDLFEHQLDSGNYTVKVNAVNQDVTIRQGKTTLLWIVDIGKFKKVYYFIF
ncbi:MAG: hypothetical protein Kow0076_7080 [Francisella sp.]